MSKRKSGVRREDFREVRPTPEELAAWHSDHGRRLHTPYRVEHKPCGKRMWYSGFGVGSHLRACQPVQRTPEQEDAAQTAYWNAEAERHGPRIGVIMSSQLGDDWRPSTHLGGDR